MFELAWPLALLALPLPLLVWWLAPPYRSQEASIQIPFFGKLAEATRQTPEPGAVVRRRLSIQMAIAALAWVLTVLAIARPQWVGAAVTREVAARDLLLAVDISGSMQQSDFRRQGGAPLKRLDGVKAVVGDFIARRHGDRVALVLFGTRAYVQVPFTQDLQTARTLLDQTEVGMAGQQTAIGDSIGLAIKVFEASKAPQKLVVLLTDGGANLMRPSPYVTTSMIDAEQNDYPSGWTNPTTGQTTNNWSVSGSYAYQKKAAMMWTSQMQRNHW
ncbi:MAG: VWA domain-containing protein, partial [Hyphomicrobiaceae bacterium]